METVKVGYHKRLNGRRNFGDDLSPLLISNILKIEAIHSPMFNADILGVGSILHYWSDPRKSMARRAIDVVLQKRPLALWGTGLIYPTPVHMPRTDILALRGPLTAQCLKITNVVPYGDPGILAADLVKPKRKTISVGIIPHYVDKENATISSIPLDAGFKIIDVEDSCTHVLEEISRCDFVLSSSLHGLICADAYGIPNSRIVLSNDIIGGDFKFNDYYIGVGREKMKARKIDDLKDIFSALSSLRNSPTRASRKNIESISNTLRDRILEWRSVFLKFEKRG